MKNLLFCFAIVLSSLNVRGDIKSAEEIPVRVNDQKTAEVLMLFSDSKLYLGRARFLPGAEVAEHNHSGSMEVVYILSGNGEFVLEGKVSTVKSGDVIHIPSGANHSFRNTGTEPVDVIQVYSPPGPEERFKIWKIKE